MDADQQYCLRWNNHKSNLLDGLCDLFLSRSMSDVTLVVDDGTKIKCHKVILVTSSIYLANILKDLPDGEHPIIVLKDITQTQMRSLLDFMYSGEIIINEDQLDGLLSAAALLKIKGLFEDKESEHQVACPVPLNTSDMKPTENGESAKASGPQARAGPSNQGNVIPSLWHLSHLALITESADIHPLPKQAAANLPATEKSNKCNAPKDGKRRSRGSPVTPNPAAPNQDAPLAQGEASVSPPNNRRASPRSNDNGNGSASQRPVNGRAGSKRASTTEDEGASTSDDQPQSSEKLEWRRYKQYTVEEMEIAIEAVKRGGETPLQVAERLGIPSRTLYDKIKKLGIRTPRNNRRRANIDGRIGRGGNRRRRSSPLQEDQLETSNESSDMDAASDSRETPATPEPANETVDAIAVLNDTVENMELDDQSTSKKSTEPTKDDKANAPEN